MVGPSTRSIARVVTMLCAAVAAALAGTEEDRLGEPMERSDGGAIRIVIETIAVDRRGTWSVGTDAADIFPGKAGVLERSVTLLGRGGDDAPRETVEIKARVTPERDPEGGCAVRIESEVSRTEEVGAASSPRAQPERRSVSLNIGSGEEQLVELYVSTLTRCRLAVKVGCDPSASSIPGSEPRQVDLEISVARAEGDAEPAPLKRNRLSSFLGRAASVFFSFNVALPELESGGERYRRESLEANLAPILISGGRLQLAVEINGELATISSSSPTVSHPVESRTTLVLEPGEQGSIEIVVSSSGEDEGWSVVRFRLDVVSRF